MCCPLQLQRSKTFGAFQEAEEPAATARTEAHNKLLPQTVLEFWRLQRRIALRMRRSYCSMPSRCAGADAVCKGAGMILI
jgi:hypothetical protein